MTSNSQTQITVHLVIPTAQNDDAGTFTDADDIFWTSEAEQYQTWLTDQLKAKGYQVDWHRNNPISQIEVTGEITSDEYFELLERAEAHLSAACDLYSSGGAGEPVFTHGVRYNRATEQYEEYRPQNS